MATQTTFEIDQQDFADARWTDTETQPLGDGEVLAKIDSFSFTANNITYAAVGHEVGYWKFFPASEPGRGIIPVWGFADIVESNNSAIAIGERLYGYWPMSTHLKLQPDKINPAWFLDVSEHRRELPAVYNQYFRCAADPGYDAATEDLQSLFRPLFITSFMIDDFLLDNDYFGAEQVIISSASSKTAFGTAFLQHRRNDRQVVGLTSKGNAAFVRGLGCYHQVLTYDQVNQLSDRPTVYVDIAGNSALRADVHQHLGESLKFSSAVGYSHLGSLEHGQQLPGPKPQFFFAPTQVQKRERDWADSGGVLGHYAAAWRAFLPSMREWIQVERHTGRDGVASVYQQALAGQANAASGQILSW